ncbi:hypothetical protein AURDEDRAFT_126208 [Auricularia subglabra TFB-10046 SS5]|nr:hypothetical protein AURDEDRAFT_126208 [Auricularia subglabra TFB-10046 SS5]
MQRIALVLDLDEGQISTVKPGRTADEGEHLRGHAQTTKLRREIEVAQHIQLCGATNSKDKMVERHKCLDGGERGNVDVSVSGSVVAVVAEMGERFKILDARERRRKRIAVEVPEGVVDGAYDDINVREAGKRQTGHLYDGAELAERAEDLDEESARENVRNVGVFKLGHEVLEEVSARSCHAKRTEGACDDELAGMGADACQGRVGTLLDVRGYGLKDIEPELDGLERCVSGEGSGYSYDKRKKEGSCGRMQPGGRAEVNDAQSAKGRQADTSNGEELMCNIWNHARVLGKWRRSVRKVEVEHDIEELEDRERRAPGRNSLRKCQGQVRARDRHVSEINATVDADALKLEGEEMEKSTAERLSSRRAVAGYRNAQGDAWHLDGGRQNEVWQSGHCGKRVVGSMNRLVGGCAQPNGQNGQARRVDAGQKRAYVGQHTSVVAGTGQKSLSPVDTEKQVAKSGHVLRDAVEMQAEKRRWHGSQRECLSVLERGRGGEHKMNESDEIGAPGLDERMNDELPAGGTGDVNLRQVGEGGVGESETPDGKSGKDDRRGLTGQTLLACTWPTFEAGMSQRAKGHPLMVDVPQKGQGEHVTECAAQSAEDRDAKGKGAVMAGCQESPRGNEDECPSGVIILPVDAERPTKQWRSDRTPSLTENNNSEAVSWAEKSLASSPVTLEEWRNRAGELEAQMSMLQKVVTDNQRQISALEEKVLLRERDGGELARMDGAATNQANVKDIETGREKRGASRERDKERNGVDTSGRTRTAGSEGDEEHSAETARLRQAIHDLIELTVKQQAEITLRTMGTLTLERYTYLPESVEGSRSAQRLRADDGACRNVVVAWLDDNAAFFDPEAATYNQQYTFDRSSQTLYREWDAGDIGVYLIMRACGPEGEKKRGKEKRKRDGDGQRTATANWTELFRRTVLWGGEQSSGAEMEIAAFSRPRRYEGEEDLQSIWRHLATCGFAKERMRKGGDVHDYALRMAVLDEEFQEVKARVEKEQKSGSGEGRDIVAAAKARLELAAERIAPERPLGRVGRQRRAELTYEDRGCIYLAHWEAEEEQAVHRRACELGFIKRGRVGVDELGVKEVGKRSIADGTLGNGLGVDDSEGLVDEGVQGVVEGEPDRPRAGDELEGTHVVRELMAFTGPQERHAGDGTDEERWAQMRVAIAGVETKKGDKVRRVTVASKVVFDEQAQRLHHGQKHVEHRDGKAKPSLDVTGRRRRAAERNDDVFQDRDDALLRRGTHEVYALRKLGKSRVACEETSTHRSYAERDKTGMKVLGGRGRVFSGKWLGAEFGVEAQYGEDVACGEGDEDGRIAEMMTKEYASEANQEEDGIDEGDVAEAKESPSSSGPTGANGVQFGVTGIDGQRLEGEIRELGATGSLDEEADGVGDESALRAWAEGFAAEEECCCRGGSVLTHGDKGALGSQTPRGSGHKCSRRSSAWARFKVTSQRREVAVPFCVMVASRRDGGLIGNGSVGRRGGLARRRG